ncbi:GNAT family N-acetyltransferase [Niabella sp.]|uniref:GNAT family N-acetyltransferase n=1 Tax=Niabella sp. TaxID=1962976 RepID=UPI00261CEF01|nr:GNAT family N-acetyltransferase [Niabella sp.]
MVTIRTIHFTDERSIADALLRELHDSEKSLNDRTADWDAIRERYLNFVKECLDENHGRFLVAEMDGRAIGFIFGYIEERDDSDFETGKGEDLYVSEGYVKKEYRKQGIYTRLNQAFEAEYRSFNIRRVYRYTLVNNTVMQSWLQQQGYKPIRLVYEKWLQ